MAEPRLREIAALSWTAALTPRDYIEENIETFQRAVDLTQRWLVEVDTEIGSHVERSKENNQESREGGSSDKSICEHPREQTAGPRGRCRLFAYWNAYKAARRNATPAEDFLVLRQLHAGFSARVAEAQAEITRLSAKSKYSHRRTPRPWPVEDAPLPHGMKKLLQLPSGDHSGFSRSDSDEGHRKRKRTLLAGSSVDTGGGSATDTSRAEPELGAASRISARNAQPVEAASSASRSSERSATNLSYTLASSFRRAGHVSPNSVHSESSFNPRSTESMSNAASSRTSKSSKTAIPRSTKSNQSERATEPPELASKESRRASKSPSSERREDLAVRIKSTRSSKAKASTSSPPKKSRNSEAESVLPPPKMSSAVGYADSGGVQGVVARKTTRPASRRHAMISQQK